MERHIFEARVIKKVYYEYYHYGKKFFLYILKKIKYDIVAPKKCEKEIYLLYRQFCGDQIRKYWKE